MDEVRIGGSLLGRDVRRALLRGARKLRTVRERGECVPKKELGLPQFSLFLLMGYL